MLANVEQRDKVEQLPDPATRLNAVRQPWMQRPFVQLNGAGDKFLYATGHGSPGGAKQSWCAAIAEWLPAEGQLQQELSSIEPRHVRRFHAFERRHDQLNPWCVHL